MSLVEFVEIYEGQPLFGDIRAFLEEREFAFVGVRDKNYFANALFIHKKYGAFDTSLFHKFDTEA